MSYDALGFDAPSFTQKDLDEGRKEGYEEGYDEGKEDGAGTARAECEAEILEAMIRW